MRLNSQHEGYLTWQQARSCRGGAQASSPPTFRPTLLLRGSDLVTELTLFTWTSSPYLISPAEQGNTPRWRVLTQDSQSMTTAQRYL